jgi:apolipoprotein N-acyltransferase
VAVEPASQNAARDAARASVNGAQRLRSWVEARNGWARTGVAFVAGLFSVLAMAPFFMWPVLFVTLPILVWLIAPHDEIPSPPGSAALRAFKSGWWFGFGYFLAGLFWIGEAFLVEADKFAWLLPFAITILPAGLALFYGVAAAVTRMFWRDGLAGLLITAVAFAVAEWIRGHIFTGFPWNVLGYAITQPIELMQTAELFGIYGLTLWAVLIFTAPLVLAAESGTWRTGTLAAIIPLFLFALYGTIQLSRDDGAAVQSAKVRLVQPSVPQREKWLPEKQGEIFQLHLDLSRQNPSGTGDNMSGITHVIWPEAAMPFKPLEHPEALKAIGELLPPGAQLISGGLRVTEVPAAPPGEPQRRAYNSMMVFDDAGSVSAIYDKVHLVPFGEYLPFQPVLEAIGLEQLTRMRGGFSSGLVPRPLLSVAGLPAVSSLICYEGIFPAAVVQRPERPGLIVNITNDGWFGNTTGPRQHLHQSRVRAVEEGVPLLRVANNGISAVVDSRGRLLHSLGMNVRGTIDSTLPPPRSPPLYTRLGDGAFILTSLAFLAFALVLGTRKPGA